jgi:glycosyltransferase involved in cell wall biosynthesis
MSGAADPLSIAIVTPTLSRSGGGIFPIVRAHACGLHSLARARVAVYGLADDAAVEDAATLAPLTPRQYRPLLPRFGYAPGLSRELEQGEHDVVHQHGLWQYPSIAVARWRRRTGRPTIISTQGMLEPWALANSAFRKRIAAALFERSNLHHASCLHCSEAEVAGIRAYGLSNPVAVIANGIDIPDAAARPAKPAWMAKGRRHLVFLGRIHPKKGIAELLNAWWLLKDRESAAVRGWTLVIAGWDDGGHEAEVRALARDLGFDDNGVIFTGALFGDAKNAALAHADAFILPSYSEGLPMTVLEAWAHGRPVFMTRECNLAVGFEAGAALEITTEPARMAQALDAGLSRNDLDAVGQTGLALAREHFSWPSIVAQLSDVYEWLAGRAPRPSFVQVG